MSDRDQTESVITIDRNAQIDPDGDWPADSESSYAIDAATDAMIRLNRRINAG